MAVPVFVYVSVRFKSQFFMEADTGRVVRADLLLYDPVSLFRRCLQQYPHGGKSNAPSPFPCKDFRPNGRAAGRMLKQ